MRIFLFSIAVLLFTSAAFADSLLVTVDTSSLVVSSSGPYTLDFQFIDGSGTGDTNNTVTLSNFLVTAGSLSSTSSITGGVTAKSSPLSITMTDSSFFNEAQVPYTPGTTLSFEVSYTTNADDPAPDSFTFAILDGNDDEIPTNNPNFNDSFLEIDLPASTSSTIVTSSGSSDRSLPAPLVLPVAPGAVTPEPTTFLLVGLSAAPLLILRRYLRSLNRLAR